MQIQTNLAVREEDSLLNTPDVFFICLALPGINRNTGSSNGSSSMILGAKDIAAGPGNLYLKNKFSENLCIQVD